MVISYIPVLLGEGISLFQGNLPETKWKLVSVKSFDTGLVQVKYKL
jgi:dihydrofolate reductase